MTDDTSIDDILDDFNVCTLWVSTFAVIEKTGDHELTVTTRIYGPDIDTDKEIETLRDKLKAKGWTLIISNNVRNITIIQHSSPSPQ